MFRKDSFLLHSGFFYNFVSFYFLFVSRNPLLSVFSFTVCLYLNYFILLVFSYHQKYSSIFLVWSYQHFQKLELPFFDLKNLNARAYWFFFNLRCFYLVFKILRRNYLYMKLVNQKKDMSSVLFFLR